MAELSASETVSATQFSHDGKEFCSDDELAAMRGFVYSAAFVKDVGRVRDGMLYCTSTLGRLPRPVPMPAPVLSYFNAQRGAQVGISPIMRWLLPGSNGFIAEMRGVTVVLNPALYARLSSPTMHSAGIVSDSEHQNIAYAFGQPAPLFSAEVQQGSMLERSGVFFQPLCSASYNVCVIGSEARADMFTGQHDTSSSFPPRPSCSPRLEQCWDSPLPDAFCFSFIRSGRSSAGCGERCAPGKSRALISRWWILPRMRLWARRRWRAGRTRWAKRFRRTSSFPLQRERDS